MNFFIPGCITAAGRWHALSSVEIWDQYSTQGNYTSIMQTKIHDQPVIITYNDILD